MDTCIIITLSVAHANSHITNPTLFNAVKHAMNEYERSKPARDAYAIGQAINMYKNVEQLTPADMVRFAAKISAMADKTGASDVVASYSYPKCSDMINEAISKCKKNSKTC